MRRIHAVGLLLVLGSALTGRSVFAANEPETEWPSRAKQLHLEGRYAEALSLYEQGAQAGDARAQMLLGIAHWEGLGTAKNPDVAVEWFRKAAVKGNASAQLNLGIAYSTGEGVPKDEALAAHWYRKAAEQGKLQAQANIGISYHAGLGVPQDYAEAARWYRLAAQGGDVDCQLSLGQMYLRGLGVAQNTVLGFQWLQKAAAGGSVSAKELLVKHQKEIIGVADEPSPDEAAAMAAYEANPSDELLEKLISIRAARGMALCAASAELGDPDLYVRGLSYMDSALDLASDNARLYSMAGLCYAMAADEDEAARATAREYLEYALYLDDTLVDARLVLGSLYFDAGEFILAIEPFETCVKAMGAATPADVADALAQSYAKTFLEDQGLAFFSETLASNPGNMAARFGRARLLRETHRNREALEELQILLKDPQADDAYRESARRLSQAWEVAQ